MSILSIESDVDKTNAVVNALKTAYAKAKTEIVERDHALIVLADTWHEVISTVTGDAKAVEGDYKDALEQIANGLRAVKTLGYADLVHAMKPPSEIGNPPASLPSQVEAITAEMVHVVDSGDVVVSEAVPTNALVFAPPAETDRVRNVGDTDKKTLEKSAEIGLQDALKTVNTVAEKLGTAVESVVGKV